MTTEALRVGSARRWEAARRRLIFALDVPTLREARPLVRRLVADVGAFKIGKELFLAEGPRVVRAVRELGGDVFLDLKLHDIPATVERAVEVATALGVRWLDVHASGGLEMMRAAARAARSAARREGVTRPRVLGVTVLTSLGSEDLRAIGWRGGAAAQVRRLAALAREAGLDGVVASPREATAVRAIGGPRFTILTPGIRPAGTSVGDQKRIATPASAIRDGADLVVVGRPIRDAADPRAMARTIVEEILHARPG